MSMHRGWELIKLVVLCAFLSCNQTKDESKLEGLTNIELIAKVKGQCPNDIIFNSLNLEIKRSGDGLYELESQNDSLKEVLNVYLENDTSILRGYHYLITDSSYFARRLIKCDSIIYFTYNKDKSDTIFKLGYYKYLYDNNLLSLGQSRYFSKNRDSLTLVKGGNLTPLPELN